MMSLLQQELRDVWDALRGAAPHFTNNLEEVRINNLRGIRGLRISFRYPVSVLAGPNGCGKSTVLLACACAYRVTGSSPRDFTPATLFPSFTTKRQNNLNDKVEPTDFEFFYVHQGQRLSMAWRRRKSWSRSFMGRRGGVQPERQLYLRTLANLTNPSEVRSFLQLGRQEFDAETISSDMLIFAYRILSNRYRTLSAINNPRGRELLFAEIEKLTEQYQSSHPTRYSEFHMSSGERAILRLSKDISNLQNALILIDEIEAGLHPYTQQQAMLELQRIALRQNLQIIVATHSPVILDSVPPEARIFLDREDTTHEVRLAPQYRDIFQKALYGQSQERMSILCEDNIAEGFIMGVLDVLNIELGMRHEDFIIGKNTGRDEFPSHIRTLGKFKKLADFIIILDGDSRHMEARLKSTAEEYGRRLEPLFLPGNGPPEQWIWEALEKNKELYANELGININDLSRRMREIDRTIEGTLKKPGERAKYPIEALADELNRSVPEIARIVGRLQSEKYNRQMSEFLVPLKEQINLWRRQ